ncbi:MAG: hypothetical protein ACRED1_09990, partial [Limisphaerales bacterium]
MTSGKKFAATDVGAVVFGLFLGLCILKFGDPVILDQKIFPPTTLSDFWNDSWPTHWANWILFPLAAILAVAAILNPGGGTGSNPGGRPGGPPDAAGSGRSVLPAGMKWLSLLPLL